MILKQCKDNLYSILCSVCSQWRERSMGVTWADLVAGWWVCCMVTMITMILTTVSDNDNLDRYRSNSKWSAWSLCTISLFSWSFTFSYGWLGVEDQFTYLLTLFCDPSFGSSEHPDAWLETGIVHSDWLWVSNTWPLTRTASRKDPLLLTQAARRAAVWLTWWKQL